jgi:hypothetical protein
MAFQISETLATGVTINYFRPLGYRHDGTNFVVSVGGYVNKALRAAGAQPVTAIDYVFPAVLDDVPDAQGNPTVVDPAAISPVAGANLNDSNIKSAYVALKKLAKFRNSTDV